MTVYISHRMAELLALCEVAVELNYDVFLSFGEDSSKNEVQHRLDGSVCLSRVELIKDAFSDLDRLVVFINPYSQTVHAVHEGHSMCQRNVIEILSMNKVPSLSVAVRYLMSGYSFHRSMYLWENFSNLLKSAFINPQSLYDANIVGTYSNPAMLMQRNINALQAMIGHDLDYSNSDLKFIFNDEQIMYFRRIVKEIPDVIKMLDNLNDIEPIGDDIINEICDTWLTWGFDLEKPPVL